MKSVAGDLIELALTGRFDVIVHGCNCFCTMGAGIARQIKARIPEAFAADQATRPGDADKLGQFTAAHVVRGDVKFVVVNAYTQFDWRGSGSKADYWAIENVFGKIAKQYAGLHIGYPRIGAGLAGGDWARISTLIDNALAGEQHTLVEFKTAAPRFEPEEDRPSLGLLR